MTISLMSVVRPKAATQLKLNTVEFRRVMRSGVSTITKVRLFPHPDDPTGEKAATAIQMGSTGWLSTFNQADGVSQGPVIGRIVGSSLAGNSFSTADMGVYTAALTTNVPHRTTDLKRGGVAASDITSLRTKERDGSIVKVMLSGLSTCNPTLAAAIRASCFPWYKFGNGETISNKLSIPPFFTYGSPIHVMALAKSSNADEVNGLFCSRAWPQTLTGQLQKDETSGLYDFTAARDADPFQLGVYSYAGACADENTSGDTGKGLADTPAVNDASWARPELGSADRSYNALDDFQTGLGNLIDRKGNDGFQRSAVQFLGVLLDVMTMRKQLILGTNPTLLDRLGATVEDLQADFGGTLQSCGLDDDTITKLTALGKSVRDSTGFKGVVWEGADGWAQGYNNYKTRNFLKVVHRNGNKSKNADTRVLRFRPIFGFGYQHGKSNTSDNVEKAVNLRGDRTVNTWFTRALTILTALAQAGAHVNALESARVFGIGRPDLVDVVRGSSNKLGQDICLDFRLAFAALRSIKADYPDLYPMATPSDRIGNNSRDDDRQLHYYGRLAYRPWGVDDLIDTFTPGNMAQGFIRTNVALDVYGYGRYCGHVAQHCWFKHQGSAYVLKGQHCVARSSQPWLDEYCAGPYLVPVATSSIIDRVENEVQARTWMNYSGPHDEGANYALGQQVSEQELGFKFVDGGKSTSANRAPAPFHDVAGFNRSHVTVPSACSVNVSHGLTVLLQSVKEAILGEAELTDGDYAAYTPGLFAIKKLEHAADKDGCLTMSNEGGIPMYNSSGRWKGGIQAC